MVQIGRIYKHFKGHYYRVVALGKDSETCEEKVVYQNVETGDVWVRPLSMWNDIINEAGECRFTLVDSDVISK